MMTTIYIDSNATGLADGTSWTDAYTTINAAFAAGTAGDTFLAYFGHYETADATIDLLSPGTVEVPCKLISSDYSNTFTEAISAQVYAGPSAFKDINLSGKCICYGVYLKGTDDLNNNTLLWSFYNSTIEITSTGGGVLYNGTTNDSTQTINYKNVKFILPNETDFLSGYSYVSAMILDNCDMSQVKDGSNFYFSNTQRFSKLSVRNCDLTNFSTLVRDTGLQKNAYIEFLRCKLKSSVVYSEGVYDSSTAFLLIHSCDSGSGYHFFYYENYYGKWLESLTSYRDNGSLYDINNSSSNYSCEVQTNANVVEFSNPLEVKLPAKKVDLTAGAVTLTVHIIQRNGTVVPSNLTDMNCILRAVAPDTTDTTLGVEYKSSTKDILSTATDLPASTETWTTPADGANEVKQQVSVTIPQNTQPGMTSAIVQLYLDVSKNLVNEDSGAGEIFVDFDPVVS